MNIKTFDYCIKDEYGINVRPAGLLVKAAKAFEYRTGNSRTQRNFLPFLDCA